MEYYVDEAMLGSDWTDDDDLQRFCGVLQRVVGDRIKVVPVTDSLNGARNDDPDTVTNAEWEQAIREYGMAVYHEQTVTVRVDMENNAEDWWDAVRVRFETDPPKLSPEGLRVARELILGDLLAGDMAADDADLLWEWCAGTPGWDAGPRYAATALIITNKETTS